VLIVPAFDHDRTAYAVFIDKAARREVLQASWSSCRWRSRSSVRRSSGARPTPLRGRRDRTRIGLQTSWSCSFGPAHRLVSNSPEYPLPHHQMCLFDPDRFAMVVLSAAKACAGRATRGSGAGRHQRLAADSSTTVPGHPFRLPVVVPHPRSQLRPSRSSTS
jgi:hypothetical protein